jgi:hypothetical protein
MIDHLLHAFFQPQRHAFETRKDPLGLVVMGNAPPCPESRTAWRRITYEGTFLLSRKAQKRFLITPRKGRRLLLVTRETLLHKPLTEHEAGGTFADMLALSRIVDSEMPLVLGGASVFSQAIPYATRLFVIREYEDHPFVTPPPSQRWFEPVPFIRAQTCEVARSLHVFVRHQEEKTRCE